jgi:hypothetical protein
LIVRESFLFTIYSRVSVQGVTSLGGHFATLCRELDLYEAKKKKSLLIFRKKMEILLFILIVKSLQKEQNSILKSTTMTPNLPE